MYWATTASHRPCLADEYEFISGLLMISPPEPLIVRLKLFEPTHYAFGVS